MIYRVKGFSTVNEAEVDTVTLGYTEMLNLYTFVYMLYTITTLTYLSLTLMCAKSSVMSDSLEPMELSRLLCPWDPPGNNTGVGCHALL